MNAVYVRDPMCVVRGGAVIGRMGPLMRRGEERYATQAVAALGMPVLRTISGTGTLEGGTLIKITPRVYAFGASIRCNPEGARQLAEVLAPLGVELIVVPLAGWSIHLDGHLSMVDRDKALCDVRRLPYWFVDRLRELGIELIEVLPEEDWAVNGLVVRPGRLLLSEGNPRTVERLGRRGVEVVEVAVRRDPAGRRRHPLHDDGAPARARRLSSASPTRRGTHELDRSQDRRARTDGVRPLGRAQRAARPQRVRRQRRRGRAGQRGRGSRTTRPRAASRSCSW